MRFCIQQFRISLAGLAALIVGVFVLVAGPATALPVTMILSDMSSEQEEGGTPPSVLDAAVTVELAGTDLKITIDNNTSGGFGAGDYDISEIYLNIAGETVVSVSPSAVGNSGYELLAPPTTSVAGLGDYTTGFGVAGDLNLNSDLIVAGEQDVMVFLSCLDGDCSGASILNNSAGKAVAAKFINGGPAYEDDNDSAFGASPVPEPSTALLMGLGLIGLAWRGRQH
jgi:hypothetical protein